MPFLNGIIQDDHTISPTEKRHLAPLPPLPTSLKEVSDYPVTFNDYYADHFGYRERLTAVYFKIMNKFSHKTAFEHVTMGQNGWLFLGSMKSGYKGNDDPIGDALNVNLYTDDELQEFAQSIVSIHQWLKKRGIEYIYMIAPNKHTIYFEQLPKYLVKLNEQSATDQIIDYLKKYTDVTIVDLRATLFAEKKKHDVYFKTDTHWNHYGANVSQFVLMKQIKSLFPKQISPFLLTDQQFTLFSKEDGDLAMLANLGNLKDDYPDPIFDMDCIPSKQITQTKEGEAHTILRQTMQCQNKTLNALIFGDSFMVALEPYISRNFYRSTYIQGKINYPALAKYVKEEKPDIVIEEVIERSLPYIPNNLLGEPL